MAEFSNNLDVHLSGPVYEQISKGFLVPTKTNVAGMEDRIIYYINPKRKIPVLFCCCLCGKVIKNPHGVPKHKAVCNVPDPVHVNHQVIMSPQKPIAQRNFDKSITANTANCDTALAVRDTTVLDTHDVSPTQVSVMAPIVTTFDNTTISDNNPVEEIANKQPEKIAPTLRTRAQKRKAASNY